MASETKGPEGVAAAIVGRKNERGTPSAVFIEDEAAFLASCGGTLDEAIKALYELHGKYQLMEGGLMQDAAVLKQKLPELQKTLKMIAHLKSQKEEGNEIITHFPVADNVYAEAKLNQETDTVYLWLGANVMVEYSYDEAATMLSANLKGAEAKLEVAKNELEFVRQQAIIAHVNIARLFNYDKSTGSA